MPFYYQIDSATASGRRTAQRLLDLRKKLKDEVPAKTLNDTLLLATWNIREFDSNAFGLRLDESFYYIAEIISHFDLVAVQEVREDLRALDRVIKILGDSTWDYIVTDVTEGRVGNRERLAFVYDTRKVKFASVAGEVVMPPVEVKKGGKVVRYDPARQLYRTPFLVGFRSGWFEFMLCTVHIIYGEAVADDPARVEEIRLIASFLKARTEESDRSSQNIILLGDFNIFGRGDVSLKAILDAGFVIPAPLQDVPPTNVGKEKHCYDQIAFKVRPDQLHLQKSGVFDFYELVFTGTDLSIYATDMGERLYTTEEGKPRDSRAQETYYRNWRTHQMSDHLPMWCELKIDFGQEYLESKAKSP